MPVSRAPKRPPALPVIPEDRVQEVIRRGGTVAADLTAALPSQQEVQKLAQIDVMKNVQLRLYESTLQEIDQLRRAGSRGRRPSSRHAWLLDAIDEKLERERRKQR